jgi:hypothetical protein
MAGTSIPRPVMVRAGYSMVQIVLSADEGLAVMTFSLYDSITKYDREGRWIHGTDAYTADELMALSKALAAAARRLNRAA